MATPLANNDKLLVVYGSNYGEPSQLGEFRVYYNVVNAAGRSVESLADLLGAMMRTQMIQWLGAGCTYGGCSVQRLFPPPRTTPVYSIWNTASLNSSATLPSQVSGVIRYRTSGLPGIPPAPGTHGRSYIPFPADRFFDHTKNKLNAAGTSVLQGIADKVGPLFTVPGSTVRLQLLVRQPEDVFQEVSSVEVLEFVGTQRRRGAFGQRNRPFGS